MAATTRRPALVTVLVVLVVVAGVLSILAGIIAITATGFAAVGAVALLIGLIYLAVSKGLLDGRNWARVTVAVVSAVNVILAILAVINSAGSNNQGSAFGSGIFGLIVLAILFSPKANAFFGTGSVSSRPA